MPHSNFNPKARWDRHIPEASETSHPEQLNERIELLAWFKQGKIHPRLFIWNSKEYKITKITYNWQERRGQEVISYFSVSTGANLYQVSFSNVSYSWRINKLIE